MGAMKTLSLVAEAFLEELQTSEGYNTHVDENVVHELALRFAEECEADEGMPRKVVYEYLMNKSVEGTWGEG